MAQILIDQIDETMLAQLSELARANSRSVEAQAKDMLEKSLLTRARRAWRLETAERIAAMTPAEVQQTDSLLLLREDRDR